MIARMIALGLILTCLGGCGVGPELFKDPFGAIVSDGPANPTPPQLNTYTTKVYWAKDIEALARDLRRHPRQDVIIYGVTAEGYKVMQNNWAELSRYIEGQHHVIAYYRGQDGAKY